MIERVSTIRQVEPKTGRTGSFTLVTVVHELNSGAGVAVTEEQDLVYRQAVAEAGGAGPAGQGPAGDRQGRLVGGVGRRTRRCCFAIRR